MIPTPYRNSRSEGAVRIDILSLFPEIFGGFLTESIPRLAQEKGQLRVFVHNFRLFSTDKHSKVDDRPFGGGPGMVLKCQPLIDAVHAVQKMDSDPGHLIFLTPEGQQFKQTIAKKYASMSRLILVCGRYEGFDDRIFTILQPERLSIGDYILSGGEAAAICVVDAVARLLPGVLGTADSLTVESFASQQLDYPQYTQPATYMGLSVPDVLLSGDHKRIDMWRKQAAWEQTKKFRPDLLGDESDVK